MSRFRQYVLLFLAMFFTGAGMVSAEERTVALRVAPPFVMPDGVGGYTGLTVELWERIAERLGLEYRYQEMELNEVLQSVEEGTADFGVAALTITSDRERVLDFTHPFHTSGLGIGVREDRSGLNWWGAAGALFSPELLRVLLGLAVVLLGTGFLLLLFERKKNAEQFGGTWWEGLGASFWWSAVTMTTVGYGDKAPITFWGRVVALYWMFAGIIIISSFTAAIASALTVSSISQGIEGPDDLMRHETAVLANSTSAAYLAERNFRYREVSTLAEAMELLQEGKVAAMVHDAPILQYLFYRESGLRVLPGTFQRQDYGIALPLGEPLRQEMNVILLEEIQSPWWKERLTYYLGR